jgi:hypothetical protein
MPNGRNTPRTWLPSERLAPHQLVARSQQRFEPMALFRLHVHRAVPARPQHLRQRISVRFVRLHPPAPDGIRCAPGIHAHYRKTHRTERPSQPWRHRSAFQTYLRKLTTPAMQRRGNDFRMGVHNPSPHNFARLVDDANRCPLETNVQSCKHPHRCSPSFARGITSGKVSAGEQQPHVWDVLGGRTNRLHRCNGIETLVDEINRA